MGNSTFYFEKQRLNKIAKLAVAFRAALFLQEGDSLLIDAGTSLTPIAKILRAMAKEYSKYTHYTIMTHNRAAFDSLIDAPSDAKFNLFQTGGRYDSDLNASFGHQAEGAYEDYHPKWVFIGQSGINADRGPFCHGNTEELSLKMIIFSKPAYCRVIVSDYTKLGIPGGLCFGSSDRLTDNVEHCVLLTNDPRADESIADVSEVERIMYYDRFERERSILSDTHGVVVIPVRYVVERRDNGLIDIRLGGRPTPEKKPSWMGIADSENRITIRDIPPRDFSVEEIVVGKYPAEKHDEINERAILS